MKYLKILLIDVITSMPAALVLALGMGHIVNKPFLAALGAIGLLVLNNFGRDLIEKAKK